MSNMITRSITSTLVDVVHPVKQQDGTYTIEKDVLVLSGEQTKESAEKLIKKLYPSIAYTIESLEVSVDKFQMSKEKFMENADKINDQDATLFEDQEVE